MPLLVFALLCLAPGSSARAGTETYVVDVNTSSLVNGAGYLDFQFNPVDSTSVYATAGLTNFSTDGMLNGVVYQNGDASGTLPGPLSFDNGTPTNELTYAFTYGTVVSFDVTLSQATVGGSGSFFAFSLLDGDGYPYSTGTGATVYIAINPDGTTTATAYPPISAGGPTATVVAASVPEPSTLVSGLIGLSTLLGGYHVRRRMSA